jgi:hypothetical protein
MSRPRTERLGVRGLIPGRKGDFSVFCTAHFGSAVLPAIIQWAWRAGGGGGIVTKLITHLQPLPAFRMHGASLRVSCDSHQHPLFPLNSIKWLVFIVQTGFVLCEIGSNLL